MAKEARAVYIPHRIAKPMKHQAIDDTQREHSDDTARGKGNLTRGGVWTVEADGRSQIVAVKLDLEKRIVRYIDVDTRKVYRYRCNHLPADA